MIPKTPIHSRRAHAARLALSLTVGVAVAACDRSPSSPMAVSSPAHNITPCTVTNPCDPPPPPPFDNSAFGVVSWVNYDNNPLFIDLAANAHVAWVRLPANWNALQPNGAGTLDPDELGKLRATVHDLKLRGISSYVSLAYTPAWTRYCYRNVADGQEYSAQPGEETIPCATNMYSPPDPAMYIWWHSFVGMMLDSLPEVHDWSIWNEPNTQFFLNLPAGQDPIEAYANLVVWAADQIHRRPGYRVLAPELAYSSDSRAKPGQQSNGEWLGEFIRTTGYLVDVVTVHGYNPAQNIVATMADYGNNRMQYMPAGIPLWLTEAGGGGTDHNDDATQAKDLTAVYRAMTSHQVPRWQKTFWFSLYFPPNVPEQPYYQLTRQAGTVLRPAYNCLSALASGTSLPLGCL